MQNPSLVAQAILASFVSLTGATGSVEHGEVTTQSTSAKDEGQVNLFLILRVVITFESGDLFDTTH